MAHGDNIFIPVSYVVTAIPGETYKNAQGACVMKVQWLKADNYTISQEHRTLLSRCLRLNCSLWQWRSTSKSICSCRMQCY